MKRKLFCSRHYYVTLIWISLSISLVQSATEGVYHIRGQLSDVADIINYVKPFIRSMQRGRETIYKRSKSPPTLDIAIGNKINQLQPYLQDHDEEQLEFNAETTIAEFKSSKNLNLTKNSIQDVSREMESFLSDLKKYKKMKHQIKSALKRESVSNKTKLIVRETLDVLVPTLVQKQCPQGVSKYKELNKRLTTPNPDIFIENILNITNKTSEICYINGEKYNFNECEKIKNEYKHCKLSEEECTKIAKKAVIEIKMTKLNERFDSLNLKLENQSTVDLHLNEIFDNSTWWNKQINDKTYLRILNKSDTNFHSYKDVCKNIRLCSEELKDFCTVFYQSLYDIPVRVFRNYAAMYNRDIGDESVEKNAVIATIKQASDNVEKRMSKVFIKTIHKVDLDKNKDREKNIAVLQKFVKHTVKRVNKTVNKHIEEDLSSLRARQLQAIKEDLSHNLDTELKDFESDVVKHICSFFVTCNGNLLKKSLRTPLFREFIVSRAKLNNDTNLILKYDNFLSKPIRKHDKMMYNLNERLRTRSNTKNLFIEIVTMKPVKINDEVDPTTKINEFIKTENADSYNEDEEIDSYSLNITM